MPRPMKPRWINGKPGTVFFVPHPFPDPRIEHVALSLDELEALKLADHEDLSQEEASVEMNVSRATFGRIVRQARKKVAEALVTGKAILVEGGEIEYRPPGRGPGHGYRGGGRGRGRHGGRGMGPYIPGGEDAGF